MQEQIPIRVEVLPFVDRVVSVGLWIGRLFTQHHAHAELSEHFITDGVDAEITQVQRDANKWAEKIDLV